MTKQNKIILALLIFVALLALIFLFKGVILKLGKPLVENDELKLLRQFFPEKSVAPQNDKGHYVIDGKDYYVKSMGDVNHDGSIEFVSMEIVNEQGKTYRFYSKIDDHFLLLGEDTSLIWHIEDEKNREMEFVTKDITGDSINEILIPILISGSNVIPYHIFMIDSEIQKLKQVFEKSYFSVKPEGEITFDEIYRENNLVVMTWHGTYERGKSYYYVEGNILNFEKSSGFYGNPENDKYEYREISKDGSVIYKETRAGNMWEDKFERK